MIEILIVMVILIFGLNTTAFFSRYITKAGIFSSQQSDAIHLAHVRLEQMRLFRDLVGYNSIVNGSSSVTGVNASFQLVWTVTANVNPNYKLVKVVTSWNDVEGVARSVELASVVAFFDPLNSGAILQ
ncbi:MAG: hypothetical protein H7832_10240 [Magnetococcus sp. DMHC-6]